ncbi:single-stranded DNA-binding protein [Cyclobacterium qasimii]|uniref:Single-stranded DNA-binding protein n=2 Tax=Cyclobacterium qasimii TaxID=1350429 RepID=S7V802_9BACT|nr:single-stranded DNA-binding protein [Cyclobacterium qasimii]EPR66405.1 Single-stranded DNA-binding protein [Cyclobacterium qasimii M12-11B]GEO21135.1 single-stranded DNA-binding protein [Cyclobacterium qasimii]
MAGVNKVILLGNLGADPEVKHLEGDKVVANLRLATTESYKDRSGNRVENTEWHDLELWDGQAKVAEQYLKKGSQIYVEGKIKSDTWQDDQGNNRKRTKIRVQSFTMLGGKSSGPENPQGGNQGQPAQNPNSNTNMNASSAKAYDGDDNEADDLPF